jgi:hypothetical protein
MRYKVVTTSTVRIVHAVHITSTLCSAAVVVCCTVKRYQSTHARTKPLLLLLRVPAVPLATQQKGTHEVQQTGRYRQRKNKH